MLDPADVLFLGCGLGSSTTFYYRSMLPAKELGASYVAVKGEPPTVSYVTGLARGESDIPDLDSFKVVVMQQADGPQWTKLIREMRSRGILVLYEIDDYVHAIPGERNHDARHIFTKQVISRYEMAMKACDGIICSTDFLAEQYRHRNRRVYVCPNGLDLRRYDLTRLPRERIRIGWAGAIGHVDAVASWLPVVADVMRRAPETDFVTIGQNFTEPIKRALGGRTLAIPFCAIEQYPAAMTIFDIAIGPATNSSFYRAKSDLRWLEAGALGIPLVGDHRVYHTIDHGTNGFQARDQEQARHWLAALVEDENLRTTVGQNARDYVSKHRAIKVTARRYLEVFELAMGHASRGVSEKTSAAM